MTIVIVIIVIVIVIVIVGSGSGQKITRRNSKARLHWRVHLRIHWTLPVQIHWKVFWKIPPKSEISSEHAADNPSENASENPRLFLRRRFLVCNSLPLQEENLELCEGGSDSEDEELLLLLLLLTAFTYYFRLTMLYYYSIIILVSLVSLLSGWLEVHWGRGEGPWEAPQAAQVYEARHREAHEAAPRRHGARGKILHTRNRYLRNHRGFPVAFPNGFSVIFSNTISLVSDIFRRIVTFPVDFHWNLPMDFQWHSPMEFHFCDFWCVIFCPERELLFSLHRVEVNPNVHGPHWTNV